MYTVLFFSQIANKIKQKYPADKIITDFEHSFKIYSSN